MPVRGAGTRKRHRMIEDLVLKEVYAFLFFYGKPIFKRGPISGMAYEVVPEAHDENGKKVLKWLKHYAGEQEFLESLAAKLDERFTTPKTKRPLVRRFLMALIA